MSQNANIFSHLSKSINSINFITERNVVPVLIYSVKDPGLAYILEINVGSYTWQQNRKKCE